MSIEISKDPQANWDNNQIQFPRFIAECYAVGLFSSHAALCKVALEMDLEVEEVQQIIDRAQETWDDIKTKL